MCQISDYFHSETVMLYSVATLSEQIMKRFKSHNFLIMTLTLIVTLFYYYFYVSVLWVYIFWYFVFKRI